MKRNTGALSSCGGFCMKSPRSLPAVKVSDVLLKTTAVTDLSPAASVSAAFMRSYIASVSAFFFAGRAKRMTSVPPSRRVSMSSMSVVVMRRAVIARAP